MNSENQSAINPESLTPEKNLEATYPPGSSVHKIANAVLRMVAKNSSGQGHQADGLQIDAKKSLSLKRLY